MNLFAAWKKVTLFGAFGAIGCLVGALIGEVHLFAANQFGGTEKAGRAPSLISKSTEPPPLPNDMKERIDAAGGKTGDVQISLIWYNVNDLDLHCEDPNREVIFYKRPRSRSGGELDVDANAGNNRDGRANPITDKPVENIYWPKGGAPAGTYRVYVNYFAHRPEAGAPNETKFKVNVLHDGKRHEFEGNISNNGTSENMRLIYEFALNEKLELYAPTEIDVAPGATLKVPVAVRRSFVRGPIEVNVENLPEGVTASKLTIPEGKDEGELELKATSATEGKRPIKLVATSGNTSGSADSQLAVVSRFSVWSVISTGIWTAFLAIGLCLALLAGQNKYVGKPLFAGGRVPLALVVLGAALAGFVSGSVGQALFFVLISLGVSKIGLVLGWMLLGTLLGAGVSFFVPNLDAKKAAFAGLAGGLLGAVAFLILATMLETLGRFGGAISLGFCIGAMVAVVEVAFRRAWLEVRFGEREMITVNLGPEPVKIGGNASLCTVWARGAADVALCYWIRDGKVQCEDVPSKRESVAVAGDTRSAGGVTVVVRTSGTAAPASAPPPPPVKPLAAARPAPPVPPAVPLPPTPVPPPAPAKPPAATPPKPPSNDYDDGLPMPLSPPPPPRPAAKSILDFDDAPAVPAKPQAPAAPKPPAPAKPQAAIPPKPPTPSAPAKPQAAPPAPKPPAPANTAKPGGDPDACPSCGRKSPGRPGSRYCMVCDKTF